MTFFFRMEEMSLRLGPFKRWWEKHINCMFQRVFYYNRQNPFENNTICVECRIGMNIYEPRTEILIHAEFTLDQLEAAVLFTLSKTRTVSPNEYSHCLLHARKGMTHKIVFIAIYSIKIALEGVEVNLIPWFILSKLFAGNLDCLSGDVNKRVVYFDHIE